ERVVGLVGAYNADVTSSASRRSERLRVPFVNGDDSAGFLTEKGLDWLFPTGPPDRTLAESFFSTLSAVDPKVETIGILQVRNQQGEVAAGLTRSLAAQGGYRASAARTARAGQREL